MKLKAKVRRLMVDIKECVNINEPDNPGIFVRGDGSRYREWLYIKSLDDTNSIWNRLSELKPTKTMFISGEFGSSSFNPAMILRGVLFVKWGYRIEFGDPSRLKNSSVWHSRDHV